MKEGDGIGRILMIEFGEQDSPAFDEVMDILKCHPDFDYQQLNEDSVLSIPGLEIYPNRRKIYRGRKEISLTVKEYDLFYLLVVNQGHILTYNQIYQKVWGEDALGNECDTIKCHIRNLREKLYAALPDACFTIRCEREVGYCFELNTEQKRT